MKKEIENLLKTLGIHDYLYVDNIDDVKEGFYYNPRPETLVRIMFSIGNKNVYDAYITIDRFVINTGHTSVGYKIILNGGAILTSDGEFDSTFYARILSNLNQF